MQKPFLLVGNYGVGNFGDEALKEYFLSAYPEVRWQVLSANPQAGELPRLPFGLRSAFSTPWWKTVRAFYGCRGLVFGGGTLFTDVESVRACWLWGMHAACARLFGKPIILAFQGIGPFRTHTGRFLAGVVCKWATSISVRDENSVKFCESYVKNKKIVHTFDPIFSLFLKQKTLVQVKNVFSIIPRKNSTESLGKAVENALLGRLPVPIKILSLEPDSNEEQRCTEVLQKRFGGEVLCVRTAAELAEHVSRSEMVVTQRYHGAVAALALDIPFVSVPQAKNDKLDAIAHTHKDGCKLLIQRGEQELQVCLHALSGTIGR